MVHLLPALYKKNPPAAVAAFPARYAQPQGGC